MSDPRQPRPTATTISSDELVGIAKLLVIIDGFLRSNSVPNLLADYLGAIGADHPGYDAALLIDQVSFTARALRRHRRVAPSADLGDAGQNLDDLR